MADLTTPETDLPDFGHPLVQKVYAMLCETAGPPDPEEHWEGWMARRIVAALSAARREAEEARERALEEAVGIVRALEGNEATRAGVLANRRCANNILTALARLRQERGEPDADA